MKKLEFSLATALALVVFEMGCAFEPLPVVDAGPDAGIDTGPIAEAGIDAGPVVDAGPVIDAGPDAGPLADIRVLHLSGGTGPVDVFANQAGPVIDALAFGESSDYLSVAAGTYAFDIAPTGQGVGASVLALSDLALAAATAYTAFAYNDDDQIAGAAFSDSTDGLAAGDIRLRAIHAAKNVGNVNIVNVTPLFNGTNGQAAALYEDVTLGDVGETLDVPAGAYIIGVDVIEVGEAGSIELYFNLPSLPGGTLANVFAAEDADGDIFLLAQLDADTTVRIDPAEDPRVRVLHAAGAVGAVDLFVDGDETAAAQSLAFGESTDSLSLAPGTYDFDVALTGQGLAASALRLEDVILAPGRSYTAYAYHNEAGALLGGAFGDTRDGLGADQIRARAVHAAEALGDVNIWNVTDLENPTPLFTEVSFEDVSAALDLPAGTYALGIDINRDNRPNLLYPLPELAGGTLANVFATPNPDGTFVLVAQLYADDIPASTTAVLQPLGAQVRVLHLAAAGPVDLYVDTNEAPAVEDLVFLQATAFLPVNAGARTFEIAPQNTTRADAVLALFPTLLPERGHTAFAYGRVVDDRILGDFFEDSDEGLASDAIRVRAIHAAADVGEVDILNVTDPSDVQALFSDVPYGAISETQDIPAGTYSIGLDVDNDGVADLTFDLPAVSGGSVVNIFASQAYGEVDAPVFLAVVVDDAAPVRIDPN
jgi:hypothetical protein